MLLEWQRLWESPWKGRSLFRLVPNIVEWLEVGCSDFLPPKVARLLSGHFQSNLNFHRIGLSPSGECDTCGVLEDQFHRVA